MKVTILDNSSIGGHSFWTTFQASHYVLRPVVFFTNTFSALSILWLFSVVTTRWSHIHNFSYCLVGAQRSRFTGKNRTSVEWRENVLKPLLWENKQEQNKDRAVSAKSQTFLPILTHILRLGETLCGASNGGKINEKPSWQFLIEFLGTLSCIFRDRTAKGMELTLCLDGFQLWCRAGFRDFISVITSGYV